MQTKEELKFSYNQEHESAIKIPLSKKKPRFYGASRLNKQKVSTMPI